MAEQAIGYQIPSLATDPIQSPSPDPNHSHTPAPTHDPSAASGLSPIPDSVHGAAPAPNPGTVPNPNRPQAPAPITDPSPAGGRARIPDSDHAPNPTSSPEPYLAPADAQLANPSPSPNPALAQTDKEPKKKRIRTAEAMEEGQEISICSIDRKTPSIGDESTAALITWSTPKCDGRWKKPASLTRKKFAVAIGHCWDELLAPIYPDDSEDAPTLEMVVFLEHHKNGDPHFHAVLQAPRNKLWHHLPVLLRDRRIACDVQIGVGQGVKHIDNMLRYCMVPSVEKLEVDGSPFFSHGTLSPPFCCPPSAVQLDSFF